MIADTEVIVGDCIEVMRGMAVGSAQLVFADPPYNQGVDYGSGSLADRWAAMDYREFMYRWIVPLIHLVAPGGALWILISEAWADDLGKLLSERIERRNRIIWRERFGQYRDDKFASGHRHLFYHTKVGADRVWNPDAIRVPSERMRMGDKRAAGPRVPDDVWDVSRVQGNDGERMKGHPCQLRQWPLRRIIACCTNPGDLVLDPFCGSGTTGVAAVQLGRRFVGIELNPEYAEMARRRIAEPEPEVQDVEGQALLFEEPT